MHPQAPEAILDEVRAAQWSPLGVAMSPFPQWPDRRNDAHPTRPRPIPAPHGSNQVDDDAHGIDSPAFAAKDQVRHTWLSRRLTKYRRWWSVRMGASRGGAMAATDPTFYRSPGAAIAAAPEQLAYVAAFDPAGQQKDAIAVVDCDPSSPTADSSRTATTSVACGCTRPGSRAATRRATPTVTPAERPPAEVAARGNRCLSCLRCSGRIIGVWMSRCATWRAARI